MQDAPRRDALAIAQELMGLELRLRRLAEMSERTEGWEVRQETLELIQSAHKMVWTAVDLMLDVARSH